MVSHQNLSETPLRKTEQRMKTVLTLLFVLFLCAPAGAQDLPPAMLADQYLLEATEAMEQGELLKAERAFKKIEALAVEPPPTFAYFYGKLLTEYGTEVEALRKGQALLKQFVISAGRESDYYTPTLELLSAVETKLETTERAAQRVAKLKARLLEAGTFTARLLELLLKVDAQMVRVEGGRFTMGCTREQERCQGNEKPAHPVEVRSFEMSQYEVTQEVWAAVMGENPSHFDNCPQCPVEQVSWDDVQAFLRKLNAGGGRYRLPSEAEWEYAARGGQQSLGYKYAGSNSPGAVGWYGENCGDETHPVGQKQANELGLYDLSGNVWEWVQDCWNRNYTGAPSDGRAWESGQCRRRVQRGGSWNHFPRNLRSARRDRVSADFRSFYDGFRLARSLP